MGSYYCCKQNFMQERGFTLENLNEKDIISSNQVQMATVKSLNDDQNILAKGVQVLQFSTRNKNAVENIEIPLEYNTLDTNKGNFRLIFFC